MRRRVITPLPVPYVDRFSNLDCTKSSRTPPPRTIFEPRMPRIHEAPKTDRLVQGELQYSSSPRDDFLNAYSGSAPSRCWSKRALKIGLCGSASTRVLGVVSVPARCVVLASSIGLPFFAALFLLLGLCQVRVGGTWLLFPSFEWRVMCGRCAGGAYSPTKRVGTHRCHGLN